RKQVDLALVLELEVVGELVSLGGGRARELGVGVVVSEHVDALLDALLARVAHRRLGLFLACVEIGVPAGGLGGLRALGPAALVPLVELGILAERLLALVPTTALGGARLVVERVEEVL